MADEITNTVLLQHMQAMKYELQQEIKGVKYALRKEMKGMEAGLCAEMRAGFEEARLERQVLREDLHTVTQVLVAHGQKLQHIQ